MDAREKIKQDVDTAVQYFKEGQGTGFPDIDTSCFTALLALQEKFREKEPIKDTKSKRYACKVTIITDSKNIQKYLHEEYDNGISLDDCLDMVEYSAGVVTALFENYMSGQIYQYGNYGNFWVVHGTTNGLA